MPDPAPHPASPVSFSLIIAVLGDGEHLSRLLESCVLQKINDLQILIVDQNGDDRLLRTLAVFKSVLDINRLTCEPGLSKARNLGLQIADGNVIGFPDDDCWYPADLLLEIRARFEEDQNLQALTCRCTDEHGRIAAGGAGGRSGPITRSTVWRGGVSATLFVRRGLIAHAGAFDEELGLGASTPFQSGEETDLLLRALAAGHKMMFTAELQVHHPPPPPPERPGACRRAWAYGLGMGRVLRLHGYGVPSLMLHLVTPLVGAGLALLAGDVARARLRAARMTGRWQGWCGKATVRAPSWALR